MLREAYATDPYPSPTRIEELAFQIGVGTKTIVNWFHNHRMRAKQQPPTSTSGGSNAGSIKSEPDDASNQSESTAHSPSSGSPMLPRGPGTDMPAAIANQWMFPAFEPVQFMRARQEDMLAASAAAAAAAAAAGLNGAHDLSMLKHSRSPEVVEEIKPQSPPEKDEDVDMEPDLIANMSKAEADQSNNNKPNADKSQSQEERKNKRKSSKPKWVYTGKALDNVDAEDTAKVNGKNDEDEDKLDAVNGSDSAMDADSINVIKANKSLAEEEEEEEEGGWEF